MNARNQAFEKYLSDRPGFTITHRQIWDAAWLERGRQDAAAVERGNHPDCHNGLCLYQEVSELAKLRIAALNEGE